MPWIATGLNLDIKKGMQSLVHQGRYPFKTLVKGGIGKKN